MSAHASMRRRNPSTIRYDPEQKEILDLISRFSRGTPPVASLVREAIQLYINVTLEKDEELREKVTSEIQQRRQRVMPMRIVGNHTKRNSHTS